MERNKTVSITQQESEEYLVKIFAMLKKLDKITIVKKKSELNNTELRLISEVIFSNSEGKRLISTQLAKKLNVTRSAISQIVNSLESRRIIKRVPDDVDRKIAYIELTDSAMDVYLQAKAMGVGFMSKLVEEFGKERLDTLLSLSDSFWETVERLNDEENNEK